MGRIRFEKGFQKQFIESVMNALFVSHLHGLLQFGLSVTYSSLKKYYNELRLLPEDLFNEMKLLSKIPVSFEYEVLPDSWGQQKGGMLSKRT